MRGVKRYGSREALAVVILFLIAASIWGGLASASSQPEVEGKFLSELPPEIGGLIRAGS